MNNSKKIVLMATVDGGHYYSPTVRIMSPSITYVTLIEIWEPTLLWLHYNSAPV